MCHHQSRNTSLPGEWTEINPRHSLINYYYPSLDPTRKPIQVPPPQKHYKIVFIKAPTPPAPTAPVIPVIPQNEEKTLVYVLVKKPEEQPEIVIPTQAPTQPSKPEVYFIKYKTQVRSRGNEELDWKRVYERLGQLINKLYSCPL